MTLAVSFQSDLEARLREAAAAAGKDVSALVREAVEEKLAAGSPSTPSSLSHEQWSEQLNAWMEEVAALRCVNVALTTPRRHGALIVYRRLSLSPGQVHKTDVAIFGAALPG